MLDNYSVMEKAVEKLTSVINISTGLAHPLDESRAKELFKALHKRSIKLGYQEVYDQALKHCWPDKHAKTLAALAEQINTGGKVQIKHPKEWGEPTVDKIFTEMGIR